MKHLSTILLLMAPVPAVAAPSPGPAVEAPSLSPFVVRELARGIHLLATPPEFRGPVIGNVTVIEQKDGVVVIDSGSNPADGRRIVSFVRSITKKPVKALAITHWHNDHPQGASAIRDAWPKVRIISTVGTREGLAGPAAEFVGFEPDERFDTIGLNQMSGFLSQVRGASEDPAHDEATRQRYLRMMREIEARMVDLKGTYIVLPTETFDDELLLDDPLNPVQLKFLGRANTNGDAVAWLPRQRIVVTGDVVVAPTPFGFFSFPEDWIGVLEQLKDMDFALLVPGHGEPQADAAYLDKLIGTLTDVRAQVGPLARQGLTLEQVREKLDFSAQSDIFGDTPRNRTLFEGYWLTPIVESAYKEARGEPIVQGGGETTVSGSRERRVRR